MNDMYSEFKKERKAGIKWAFWGLGALILLAVVGSVLSTMGSIVSAPSRVLSRTLETDNIIHNYEWFHDVHAQWQARSNQIGSYKADIDLAPSTEKVTMRMELQAMRQSCRDLVTKYNANSTKTNRSIFKGREAPIELDINSCEG